MKDAYEAFLPQYPWLANWAASFNLTIKQEDVLGASPSVGYRVPVGVGKTFGLDAGVDISSTGTRTLTTKRTVLLKNLPKYTCNNVVVPGSPLTDHLGLVEPLGAALSAYDPKDVLKREPDDLGYRLDFIVKVGGHADPLIILRRITGAGVNFLASQERTNSLEIAFADASPRAPQEVLVINWPTGLTLGRPTPPSIEKSSRAPQAVIRRGAPSLSPEVRFRLDSTLQRLQLETLLPRRF